MDNTKLTKAKLVEQLKIREAEIYALKQKLRKATLENMLLKELARTGKAIWGE